MALKISKLMIIIILLIVIILGIVIYLIATGKIFYNIDTFKNSNNNVNNIDKFYNTDPNADIATSNKLYYITFLNKITNKKNYMYVDTSNGQLKYSEKLPSPEINNNNNYKFKFIHPYLHDYKSYSYGYLIKTYDDNFVYPEYLNFDNSAIYNKLIKQTQQPIQPKTINNSTGLYCFKGFGERITSQITFNIIYGEDNKHSLTYSTSNNMVIKYLTSGQINFTDYLFNVEEAGDIPPPLNIDTNNNYYLSTLIYDNLNNPTKMYLKLSQANTFYFINTASQRIYYTDRYNNNLKAIDFTTDINNAETFRIDSSNNIIVNDSNIQTNTPTYLYINDNYKIPIIAKSSNDTTSNFKYINNYLIGNNYNIFFNPISRNNYDVKYTLSNDEQLYPRFLKFTLELSNIPINTTTTTQPTTTMATPTTTMATPTTTFTMPITTMATPTTTFTMPITTMATPTTTMARSTTTLATPTTTFTMPITTMATPTTTIATPTTTMATPTPTLATPIIPVAQELMIGDYVNNIKDQMNIINENLNDSRFMILDNQTRVNNLADRTNKLMETLKIAYEIPLKQKNKNQNIMNFY